MSDYRALSNTGQELWDKAKTLIPGGNNLVSKRSERFHPDLWPAYYDRAKGCKIRALDGKWYTDFSHMGVGSCVLGYADKRVGAVVREAVSDGSMTTLNCPEEVKLAERLTSLHPWADMARFTRTGGEACAVAIRIARAVTGRSKVAFCGYHGWHDWYLAANISDKGNLDEQLLPGLEAKGVPEELANTAIPFRYNELEEFRNVVESEGDEIAAIIMEPRREVSPDENFLSEVKKGAEEIGAVLVFDEVTSGFRVNVGGIHLTYGVNPDIAVFGKALANGIPISAVVGAEEVMSVADGCFISSTFWSERLGYVAALKTLELMEEMTVPDHLCMIGDQIKDSWRAAADAAGIPIRVSGISPLARFEFEVECPSVAETYFTQKMLEKGYLAGPAVYTSMAHDESGVADYSKAVEEVFSAIREGLERGDLSDRVRGRVKRRGFGRLTDNG